MNEPANFVNGDINGCPQSGNTYDYPFYKPGECFSFLNPFLNPFKIIFLLVINIVDLLM